MLFLLCLTTLLKDLHNVWCKQIFEIFCELLASWLIEWESSSDYLDSGDYIWNETYALIENIMRVSIMDY